MRGILKGAFIFLLSCVWEIVKYLCSTSPNLSNQAAIMRMKGELQTQLLEMWGECDETMYCYKHITDQIKSTGSKAVVYS